MNYNDTLAKEATASSNRVAQWSTNLERHGYKWQTIRLRKKSKHSPSVAASNSLPQSVSNDQWFLHDQFRLPPLSVLPQELSFRLDIGEIWEVVPPPLITGQSKCRLETCIFNSYFGNARYCSWPPLPFSLMSRGMDILTPSIKQRRGQSSYLHLDNVSQFPWFSLMEDYIIHPYGDNSHISNHAEKRGQYGQS